MSDGSGIVENHALFGPFMPKHVKSLERSASQALGPSKSEPPSKTMPDGIGIVENHCLIWPVHGKHIKSNKTRLPSLGTINIGTAVKNYAGWYRHR